MKNEILKMVVRNKREGQRRPLRMLCSVALYFWRDNSDLNLKHFIIKYSKYLQISAPSDAYLDADSEARTRDKLHVSVRNLSSC